MTFPTGSWAKCPPPAPTGKGVLKELVGGINPSIPPASPGLRIYSTGRARGVGSGKLMGTEDLQGRAGFREGRAKQRVIYRVSSNLHSRWHRGCKDLQGQGRSAFYGSLLGNERLLPLTAVTWGGMWELMDLQGASPLFWRSQTGHHGEPALSQHGCMLQLLSAWPQQPQGHSRVSLSHHCPGAVFQGQSW